MSANLFPDGPGETACDRCGARCRVNPARNEDARLLRRSKTPEGFCADCAVTEYLVNTYPINMMLEESQHGPQILLVPGLREHFAGIMRAGNSDMDPAEIDWQKVVDNWHLPLKVKRGATNPHAPGDSMRQRLARKEVREESIGGKLMKLFREEGRPLLEDRLDFIPPNDEEEDGGYIC